MKNYINSSFFFIFFVFLGVNLGSIPNKTIQSDPNRLKTKGGEKLSKKEQIKRDISNLEKVASAIGRKNYLKAYKSCKLNADVYYKPVDIIQSQLRHNIDVDVDNGTNYAQMYAIHLKHDAEFVLKNGGLKDA